MALAPTDSSKITANSSSRVKERSTARILYICIGLAVVIGIVFSILAGTGKSLSPFKSDNPQQETPPDQKPPQ